MRPFVDHVGSPSSPGDWVMRRTSDPSAFTVYRSNSNVAGLSRLEAKTSRELLPPVPVGVFSSLLHAVAMRSEDAAQHTVNTRRELSTRGVMVERVRGSWAMPGASPRARSGQLSFHKLATRDWRRATEEGEAL